MWPSCQLARLAAPGFPLLLRTVSYSKIPTSDPFRGASPKMKMEIEHWDETWGPLSESRMRERLEAEGFVVSKYVYPTGTLFDAHTHSVDKKDAVLKGRLQIRAEGRDFLLGPGDAIPVPAGTVHSAEVIGDEAVVSLDATKSQLG